MSLISFNKWNNAPPLLEDVLQKKKKKKKKKKQDEGLVECDKLLIHQSFLQQAQTKLVIPAFNNV